VDIEIAVHTKVRKELLDAAWRRTETDCPALSTFKELILLRIELEAVAE
jgi:hypothetical protein